MTQSPAELIAEARKTALSLDHPSSVMGQDWARFINRLALALEQSQAALALSTAPSIPEPAVFHALEAIAEVVHQAFHVLDDSGDNADPSTIEVRKADVDALSAALDKLEETLPQFVDDHTIVRSFLIRWCPVNSNTSEHDFKLKHRAEAAEAALASERAKGFAEGREAAAKMFDDDAARYDHTASTGVPDGAVAVGFTEHAARARGHAARVRSLAPKE